MGGKPLILLDTHCLLWMDQAITRMSAGARALADEAIAQGNLAVSAVSFWEVAMLVTKGRLDVGLPVGSWRKDLVARGVVELPVLGSIGIAAAELSNFHADPADRFIVATTQAHNATLLTADDRILAWPGRLDRRDARL